MQACVNFDDNTFFNNNNLVLNVLHLLYTDGNFTAGEWRGQRPCDHPRQSDRIGTRLARTARAPIWQLVAMLVVLCCGVLCCLLFCLRNID